MELASVCPAVQWQMSGRGFASFASDLAVARIAMRFFYIATLVSVFICARRVLYFRRLPLAWCSGTAQLGRQQLGIPVADHMHLVCSDSCDKISLV